jgi:hypothetical protein
MNKYTTDELNDILEKHAKWLKNNEDGCRANLDSADLRDAKLNGVDLRGASLMQANLYGATLNKANLEGALLTRAKLELADLRYANLKDANLRFADLHGACVAAANLEQADLWCTNLERTDFNEANLTGADFIDAMLYGARLDTAIISPDTHINFPLACPEEGAFIGWKKCCLYVPVGEDAIVSRSPVLVKLCILNTAKRSSATTRKCRCDQAEVLDIQDVRGNSLVYARNEVGGMVLHEDVVAYSEHDPFFKYEVGKIVSVDNFDECRWHGCAPGIHFFITRQEALEYNTRITII